MDLIPVANALIGEEEAKAAYDVIKSGWISMGKKAEEFENNFKNEVEAKHAISVNSGTSALHVALEALGVKENDEVIVPSLTFISTANAVLYQKAKPVLVECDEKTYNTTAEEIEKNITDKTKAIIPVDMNGMAIDYDAILEVAKKHNIPVIADSAESLGGSYKNKKIGSIAPIHIFSFFPNKNITTGEGGMITTDDDELAEKMSMIKHQGQDYRYHHVVLGYNYRMNDILASIGIEQLKKLEYVLKEKEKLVKRYDEAFENFEDIEIPFIPNYVTKHAWYMYTISVKENRDKIVEELEKKNIQTRLSFPPIHSQPLYKNLFGYNENSLPITQNTFNKLINIPLWAGLSEKKQDYVIETLKNIIKNL